VNDAWLRREIAKGVAGLLALRLDGAPAADSATKTADIWLVAMTKGRDWDEKKDAVRIRKAFETLFATCERWPAPALLLRELQARPPELRLPKPKRTDRQIKTGNEALDQLLATMKGKARTNSALKTDRQFEDSRRQAMASAVEMQNTASQTTYMEQQNR
jgi:hypothetical protein